MLATVSFGVDAAEVTAKLEFVATNGAVGVKAMTPTSFKVVVKEDYAAALKAGDRIEIHLPGFGGAYNSFGARHGDEDAPVEKKKYGVTSNGIYGLDEDGAFTTDLGKLDGDPKVLQTADDFGAAEWDASREVLKLTVANTAVKGVYVDHNFLRLANSATGLPSGLGPLPPNGGIDSDWYSTETETLNLRMTLTQWRSRC